MIGKGATQHFRLDQDKLQARGAATALTKPRLPPEVRAAKEAIVRKFLGKDDNTPLTPAEVTSVQHVDAKVLIDGYVSPEAACAARLGITEESGGDPLALEKRCQDFVVGWRRCLLETLRPKFLPPGWDLERSIRKHDDLFGPGPPSEKQKQNHEDDKTRCRYSLNIYFHLK